MKFLALLLLIALYGLLMQGCVYAPKSNKQLKQSNTLNCVHGMIDADVSPETAYSICSKIYAPGELK